MDMDVKFVQVPIREAMRLVMEAELSRRVENVLVIRESDDKFDILIFNNRVKKMLVNEKHFRKEIEFICTNKYCEKVCIILYDERGIPQESTIYFGEKKRNEKLKEEEVKRSAILRFTSKGSIYVMYWIMPPIDAIVIAVSEQLIGPFRLMLERTSDESIRNIIKAHQNAKEKIIRFEVIKLEANGRIRMLTPEEVNETVAKELKAYLELRNQIRKIIKEHNKRQKIGG